MRKVFLRRFYPMDFPLIVNFRFRTSRVFTMTEKEFAKFNPQKLLIANDELDVETTQSPFGYLVTETIGELKEYDALYEMSANLRPQFLIVYGILSFLSDEVFLPEQCVDSHVFQLEQEKFLDNPKPIFIKDEQDYSADLEKILSLLESSPKEKQHLLYTLFERWRKALFLLKESIDNSAHIDEAVLAYIHIFEVLSDEFKSDLKVKVIENHKRLVNQLIDRANGTEEKKYKDVEKMIGEISRNAVTLKPKVMQMLEDFNLLNPKSEAIILRFIAHRNAIAHGRRDLYQDKVVFPLKPFFSFIKDINEDIRVIKIFAAKIISQYIGLNRWDEDWEIFLNFEPTSLELVREFILNKGFDDITNSDYINGKVNGISPYILYIYYIKKGISFTDLENSLSKLFTTTTFKKADCNALFDIATVLADSNSTNVANAAKKIVRKSHKNQWYLYSNIRDVLKESEYYGISLSWFPEWLVDKK